MSLQAMTLVLDFAPDHWTSGVRLVALALADRVGDEGTCWPSRADIARRTGLSERQVKRHLRTLEEERVIERSERRRDNGTQQSNLWIWLWTICETSMSRHGAGGHGRPPQGGHRRPPVREDRGSLATPLESSSITHRENPKRVSA